MQTCSYPDVKHIVFYNWLKNHVYGISIAELYVYMYVWILYSEKEKLDEADGNHELSPVGDEYAVVDKSTKRKPATSENQALYQVQIDVQEYSCVVVSLFHIPYNPSCDYAPPP